jgi:hypothetical protein
MTALDHSPHGPASPQGSFWTSRTFLVSLAFSAVAVFLLLSEHRAHFLGALPFLLLALCPLLHMFMHSGHGGHAGHSDQRSAKLQDTTGDKS